MSSVNVDALFQHLMEDPDIIAPEGQRKEDIALAMAEQRARQSRNNEKALNMVKMDTNVDLLVDFLSKAEKSERQKNNTEIWDKVAGRLEAGNLREAREWIKDKSIDTGNPLMGKVEPSTHAKNALKALGKKTTDMLTDDDVEAIAQYFETKDDNDQFRFPHTPVGKTAADDEIDAKRISRHNAAINAYISSKGTMTQLEPHHVKAFTNWVQEHATEEEIQDVQQRAKSAPEKTETPAPSTALEGDGFQRSLRRALDDLEHVGGKIDEGIEDVSPSEVHEYRNARNYVMDNLENPEALKGQLGRRIKFAGERALQAHIDGSRDRKIREIRSDHKAAGEVVDAKEQDELDNRYDKIIEEADKQMGGGGVTSSVTGDEKLTPEEKRLLDIPSEEGDEIPQTDAVDDDALLAAMNRVVENPSDVEDKKEAAALARDRELSDEEKETARQQRHMDRNIDAIKGNSRLGEPLHAGLSNPDRSPMSEEDSKAFVSEHWGRQLNESGSSNDGAVYKKNNPEGWQQHLAIMADGANRRKNEAENAEAKLAQAGAAEDVAERLGPGEDKPSDRYPRDSDDSLNINNYLNPKEYDNVHEAVDRFTGGILDGLSPTEKLDAIIKWHHDTGAGNRGTEKRPKLVAGDSSDYTDASELKEGGTPKIRQGKMLGVVKDFYDAHKKEGVKGPVDTLSDKIENPEQEAEAYSDALAEAAGKITEGSPLGTTDEEHAQHEKISNDISTLQSNYENSRDSDSGIYIKGDTEYIAQDDDRYIGSEDIDVYNDQLRSLLDKHIDTHNNLIGGKNPKDDKRYISQLPPVPSTIKPEHTKEIQDAIASGEQINVDNVLNKITTEIANDPHIRTHSMRVANTERVLANAKATADMPPEQLQSILDRRPKSYGDEGATTPTNVFSGDRKPETEEGESEEESTTSTPESEQESTQTNNTDTDTKTESESEGGETGTTGTESVGTGRRRRIRGSGPGVWNPESLGDRVENINIPDKTPQEVSESVLTQNNNVSQEDVDSHNQTHTTNDGSEIVEKTGKQVGMSKAAKKALTDAGLDPESEQFSHVKRINHANDVLAAREHLNMNGINPDGNDVKDIKNLDDAKEHTEKINGLSPNERLAHHIETQLGDTGEQQNMFSSETLADLETSLAQTSSESASRRPRRIRGSGTGTFEGDQSKRPERPEPQGIGGRPGRSSEEIGERPVETPRGIDPRVPGRRSEDIPSKAPDIRFPDDFGVDPDAQMPERVGTLAGPQTQEVEGETLPLPEEGTPEREELLDADRQRVEQRDAAAKAQQEEDDAKIAEKAEQAFAQRALEGKRDYLKRNDFDPGGMSDAEVEAQFAKQRMATRVQNQAGLKHLRANGIDVNSDEFNKKFRPDGILDMHFDVNAAKNHVESEKKDGHLKAMAVVNDEFNEDRYNELRAKHSEDTSKDTDKALRVHRVAEAKAEIDNKRGMVHGEVQTMDALPDDVSKEDAMDRVRKLVELYGDHKTHLDENGGEGLLEPNHEGHLRDMMNDAIAKGKLTEEDMAQIEDEKDQHGKDFNKGSHREELDANHDKIHADRSQHDEFLHSPDSHSERANAFKHSAGDEIHARMHLREDGRYEDFQDTKDEHSPFMHQKLPEGGKGRTIMSRDHGVSEDDVDHTDTSLRTRKPDHPPKIHGADKNLLAAQQEHHDTLHGIHEDLKTLQQARLQSEDDTDEAVEKAQNALDGRKARMQELEEQHPQLADHNYKAASLGKKLHDSEYTNDDALGHVGLADMDPEALRQAKALPPGEAPIGADGKPLVWAKGIKRWVKQENLMKYMSGAPAGGGTYMPNGIDNDHPDVGSDEHAANASGPVMVTANGIHSVNPGGGSSTTGDVNDHHTNVGNILGAMVAPHHADGDPKSNKINIDKNTMDLAGANGPENQGQGETPQPGGGEAGAPPPTKPPEEEPEVFGAGNTGRARQADRQGTDKSAAHRFFSGERRKKGGIGDYIKDVLADAGGELPAAIGGGAVRRSDRWNKLRIRDFNRQEAKEQSAAETLARRIREVDDENK